MMRTAAYHIRRDEAGQIARAIQPASRALMIVIGITVAFALFMLAQGEPVFVMVAVVMAATCAMLTFGLRWYMRHKITQWIDRHAICPAYLEWDDTGFCTGGCMHDEETCSTWSSVSAVKESQDFRILMMGRGMQIIPRRALDGEAGADFERQLAGVQAA